MALLLSPLTPVFDLEGRLSFGSKAHVFRAGTTIPAPVYVDAGFDTQHANPIPTRRGVLPPAYVPAGSYRILAVGEYGDELWNIDNVTIEGADDGGGGSDPSDAAAVFSTGDLKHRYGINPLLGWVRLNGRTIGSDNSAGSERANDDCEALFIFLWQTDINLAVSGGRGASAAADWSADKTITLPDARGRALVGLSGMGAGLSFRLFGAIFDFANEDNLGAYGGRATHTLILAQMPAHAHTASVSVAGVGGHAHNGSTEVAGQHGHPNGTALNAGAHGHAASSGTSGNHSHVQGYATNGQAGADGNKITLVAGLEPVFGGPLNGVTSAAGSHNHAITVASDGAHAHDLNIPTNGAHSHSYTTNASGAHTHIATATVNTIGEGAAHNNAQPFLLVSIYMKL